MKFLVILHANYEGPGLIREWISLQNHSMEQVFAWDLKDSPGEYDFDALIVMGGPMGVHDEEKFSWLIHEKEFIKKVIQLGGKILGICLGSQLLSHCLGARVFKNTQAEIGWFQIKKRFFMHSWFPIFDDQERECVFHWHGDTYDLPEGSIPLFESDGCKNQAYSFEERILALQFHPEVTEELIQAFIEHGKDEIKPAQYIQSESRMLSNYKLYGEASGTFLYDLLDDFFAN